MKIKNLGIALLASTFLYFSSPFLADIPKLFTQREQSERISVGEMIQRKKQESASILKKIIEEDYGLKIDNMPIDRGYDFEYYYYGFEEKKDTVYLNKYYDLKEDNLLPVIKILQDKEFKRFYKYTSEAYPYSWKGQLLKIVDVYKDVGGFEGLEEWLSSININRKLKYDALFALSALELQKYRDYAGQRHIPFYNFPWEFFKECPKELAEIAAISGLDIRYSYIPKKLMKKYGKELVEIAKANPEGSEFVFNNIPVDLMEDYSQEIVEISRHCGESTSSAFSFLPKKQMKEHPKRIVEIAKLAKQDTCDIYEFISITGIIPDDETIKEILSFENDKTLGYKEIKRIHQKLNDERLIEILELFKRSRYDGRTLGCYLGELTENLMLYYAKKHGLSKSSSDVIINFYNSKTSYKEENSNLLLQRPTLDNYSTLLTFHKDVAQAYINTCLKEHDIDHLKRIVMHDLEGKTRVLTEIINMLHDNQAERERVTSALSPEVSYYTIAQGDEIFTSSFNLLYDNMAYKLGGGKDILPQNNRAEEQEKILSNGRGKILEFVKQIDKNEEVLTKFLFKTSYYGRLNEILPKDRTEQKRFLEKLLKYTLNKEDAFYLAPTFGSIFSGNYESKKVFEEILLENYEKEKKFIYGLIIYNYKDKMSEDNRKKAEQIAEQTRKEHGVMVNDLEVPQEWFIKKKDENIKTLRFKLYFHPEHSKDDIKRPEHMKIMISQFIQPGWDYSQSVNEKSEVVLTKIKENSRGEKINLEFILSNKGELGNMEEDVKSPDIISVGHRGHSYQVEDTFSYIFCGYAKSKIPFTKLVYLGSCGGFNSIPKLDQILTGKGQFISTKNMGKGIVNNTVLYEVAEALAEKPKMWREVYQSVRKNVIKKHSKDDPDIVKDFQTYSFPGDLSSLILKYTDDEEGYRNNYITLRY